MRAEPCFAPPRRKELPAGRWRAPSSGVEDRCERGRALAGSAARQLGLVTVPQVRAAGYSSGELATKVRRGELERLERGVLAIAGTPWTWERRVLAAWLAVGPSSRVSHRAAAHLLGFDGFDECPVELTVPRARRARTQLAVVHQTSHLNPLDTTMVGRFPVTSGARTIIDLCASSVSERRLAAAIGSAMRDGYTSETFLRERLAGLRLPGRRGVRLLDRVLEGPIAHSHLEHRFLTLVDAAGMERPETQQIFRAERVMRVDALWRDERVVVEVMGHRFHCTAEDLRRDAHRRNELQEIGMLVLEITTEDLADNDSAAASLARLRQALTRRRPSEPRGGGNPG